jgi:hypothetical protein
MTRKHSTLDDISVASPCPASWDGMKGDARVRNCGECKKNVYDLSSLTRAEAEKLIFQHEGSVCVRFFRRADGTILTADCPVGLAARARRTARRAASFVASLFGLAFLVGCSKPDSDPEPRHTMGTVPCRVDSAPVSSETPNEQAAK